jgi:hypothetical protein
MQHLPRIVCLEQASVASFRCSVMRERLPSVARRRTSKPFCAGRVCLFLEQAEETAGIGWGIVVTRYVGLGMFT